MFIIAQMAAAAIVVSMLARSPAAAEEVPDCERLCRAALLVCICRHDPGHCGIPGSRFDMTCRAESGFYDCMNACPSKPDSPKAR